MVRNLGTINALIFSMVHLLWISFSCNLIKLILSVFDFFLIIFFMPIIFYHVGSLDTFLFLKNTCVFVFISPWLYSLSVGVACVWIYADVCTHACMWRIEVNVRYLFVSLSVLDKTLPEYRLSLGTRKTLMSALALGYSGLIWLLLSFALFVLRILIQVLMLAQTSVLISVPSQPQCIQLVYLYMHWKD